MTRAVRIVFVDVPHHITQRGNYRQPVFFRDEDYARYLAFIVQYAHTYALEICEFEGHHTK